MFVLWPISPESPSFCTAVAVPQRSPATLWPLYNEVCHQHGILCRHARHPCNGLCVLGVGTAVAPDSAVEWIDGYFSEGALVWITDSFEVRCTRQ